MINMCMSNVHTKTHNDNALYTLPAARRTCITRNAFNCSYAGVDGELELSMSCPSPLCLASPCPANEDCDSEELAEWPAGLRNETSVPVS